MKNIINFLAIVCCLILISPLTHAASVMEQINGAIKQGDFKSVQALVDKNPDFADKTILALLDLVEKSLINAPESAALAMTAGSTMAPRITPSGAGPIAGDIKGIIKIIADKALLICNPAASDDQKQVQTPGDAKKAVLAQAMATIMNGAETIAQAPAILALDPQLVAQIQAQSAQCQEGDPLLAQRPGFRPPHFPPFISPPPVYPPQKKDPSAS